LSRDSGRQSRLIRFVSKPLVILRLQRRGGSGDLTREYDLSDGRFLAQAAASPRETRLELVAALLGRSGQQIIIAAGALRAQLIESYPQLRGIATCPE
jgi:hypothetical protein